MDFGASHDTKEQIRQAVDIVDLASNYLQLRRQGRIYVAHCPWHDDSRPSLQINPERQTYKCWVCDIGGDIFSFLMRLENLEFREVLEMLAERTGISLAATAAPTVEPGSPGDKRTQLAAMEWAAGLFQQHLRQSPHAQSVLEYLADRGINEQMREQFQIGFSAPDWEWMVRQSRQTRFSPAVLERVGLIGSRDGGGYYDRFRGRLIFPIRDVRSRPIAFGGRVLPQFADDRSAKYVNSPETPLYSKSDQLYALDIARDAVKDTGHLVVMEGYTDVIMAHQHGIANAVACCGTALGERHLHLLRRFTDQVVLVLDGDEAGQRRTSEVLELFVANQVDLRILALPEGQDPCDFLRANGREAWQSLIDTAVDALEYKLRQIESRVGANPSTHVAAEAVEEILAVLAKVNVQAGQAGSATLVRESQVLGRIARKFHLRDEEIRERLKVLRRSDTKLTRIGSDQSITDSTEVSQPPSAQALLSRWEQEIFELVLSDASLVGPIITSIPLTAMVSRPAIWLYEQCRQLHEAHQPVTFDRLLALATHERQQKLLIDLDESANEKQESDHDERLRDLVDHYRHQNEQIVRRAEIAHLREGKLDANQEEELLSKLFENLKRRQSGSLSTDG
ncbi:DNA primase [Aeoliella mucimassa]|uniref:DNA primase n=1 Tax=Aeoliella mucimassa TaxID=2527972 RepID=A0A518AQR7_9BACT|nr:DNA primase [Aeoliella mucimassa]QDU57071.1 DNA primase [Aeoliella mucimassa]